MILRLSLLPSLYFYLTPRTFYIFFFRPRTVLLLLASPAHLGNYFCLSLTSFASVFFGDLARLGKVGGSQSRHDLSLAHRPPPHHSVLTFRSDREPGPPVWLPLFPRARTTWCKMRDACKARCGGALGASFWPAFVFCAVPLQARVFWPCLISRPAIYAHISERVYCGISQT